MFKLQVCCFIILVAAGFMLNLQICCLVHNPGSCFCYGENPCSNAKPSTETRCIQMLRTNFADILFKIASSSSANSKLISSFKCFLQSMRCFKDQALKWLKEQASSAALNGFWGASKLWNGSSISAWLKDLISIFFEILQLPRLAIAVEHWMKPEAFIVC